MGNCQRLSLNSCREGTCYNLFIEWIFFLSELSRTLICQLARGHFHQNLIKRGDISFAIVRGILGIFRTYICTTFAK